MLFCPLASGSKGNAVLLKTENTTVLFDAGLSAKSTKERLETLNIDLHSIDAIFISHEHHDHTAGVRILGCTHNIPIIANYATAEAIVNEIGECPKFKIFTSDEPFDFLDLHIHPFSIRHDGVDPVAFSVESCGKKIGLCTDLGFVTPSVRHYLKDCHLLYIEANHQPEMVYASSRPDANKRRILSSAGHLSNEQAANLIADVASSNLQQVYLAHLSAECNSPEKALDVVTSILEKRNIRMPIILAKQNEPAKPTVLSS